MMIRVAEYTEKLDRLTTFESDDALDELNRVASEVLGVTFADVFYEDVERVTALIPTPAHAITICRKFGYDLVTADDVPVVCWQDLAMLIIALNDGTIPNDPGARAVRRLEIEAADFLHRDQD
jgi:hypothetical protein